LRSDSSKKEVNEMVNSSQLMSQAAYARHRRVNASYVSRLKARGILVMRGGLVDVAASDAVLDDKPVDVEQVTPTAQQPPAERQQPSAASGYATAKTVDMTYRARLRKLEFDKAEGRMLDAEAIQKKTASDYRTVRDALLGLPDRLAATLAAETDQQKVHTLLRAEIVRSLEAAADAIDAA
jgi:hypothetical protein